MKKNIICTLLLIFTFSVPLYARDGLVISTPDSIMYDRTYGLEIGRIPYKEKIEIIDVKRMFTRVRYDGLTGFIANSQYMDDRHYKNYFKSLKKYGKNYRFCVVSVPRKIPFFDLKSMEVVRHIEPGRVLPLLGESEKFYRVNFIDLEGYILKNEVKVFQYEKIEKYMRIKSPDEVLNNINLRIKPGKNRVFQFFVGVMNYFKVKFKNKEIKEKFRYLKEDITLKDFRDLFRIVGIKSEIHGPIENFLFIKSEFERLNILLFKLRTEDEYRYFLLMGIDEKKIKLLDIFKLSGKQMDIYEFMNIFSMSSKIVVIYPPEK